MKERKIIKYSELGCAIVIGILAIVSFILLPDKVGMQISASGELQNYMPKVVAIIIPVAVYAFGFLPKRNGKEHDLKRTIVFFIIAIFIQVIALITNL